MRPSTLLPCLLVTSCFGWLSNASAAAVMPIQSLVRAEVVQDKLVVQQAFSRDRRPSWRDLENRLGVQSVGRRHQSPVALELENSDMVKEELAYPDLIAAIAAECPAPQRLWTFTLTSLSGQSANSYFCWPPFDADYPLTAPWLGTVPIVEDPDFGAPLLCADGDTTCEATKRELAAHYAEELRSASLLCAAKQGTLFLQPLSPQQVDVRCEHLAITATIPAGEDEQPTYSDPISVDVSLFVADLAW